MCVRHLRRTEVVVHPEVSAEPWGWSQLHTHLLLTADRNPFLNKLCSVSAWLKISWLAVVYFPFQFLCFSDQCYIWWIKTLPSAEFHDVLVGCKWSTSVGCYIPACWGSYSSPEWNSTSQSISEYRQKEMAPHSAVSLCQCLIIRLFFYTIFMVFCVLFYVFFPFLLSSLPSHSVAASAPTSN